MMKDGVFADLVVLLTLVNDVANFATSFPERLDAQYLACAVGTPCLYLQSCQGMAALVIVLRTL